MIKLVSVTSNVFILKNLFTNVALDTCVYEAGLTTTLNVLIIIVN